MGMFDKNNIIFRHAENIIFLKDQKIAKKNKVSFEIFGNITFVKMVKYSKLSNEKQNKTSQLSHTSFAPLWKV
jgi:hypothetical protein